MQPVDANRPVWRIAPEDFQILKADELLETARWRSGCLGFVDGVLGISFRGLESYLHLEIPRCNLPGFEENLIDEVQKKKRKPASIKKRKAKTTEKVDRCYFIAEHLTFVPVDMGAANQAAIAHLLAIVDVVVALLDAEATDETDDRCDELRSKLNHLYGDFVRVCGRINNLQGLWDWGFWCDIRLKIYLSHLEKDGAMADIFYRRLNHPPTIQSGQLFFDEDLGDRITNAFAWSMGTFGRPAIDEIAEKSGLSVEEAEQILINQNLVYREWETESP